MTEPTVTDLDADRALLLRYLDLLAEKYHDDDFYPWASTVREIRRAIASDKYRRAERLGWEVADAMTAATKPGASAIQDGSPLEFAMHSVPDAIDPVLCGGYVPTMQEGWRSGIQSEIEDMLRPQT